MGRATCQDFAAVLKKALTDYHEGWDVRNEKVRRLKHPHLDLGVSLDAIMNWIACRNKPQIDTFESFLAKAQFPPEVTAQLKQLYFEVYYSSDSPSEAGNDRAETRPSPLPEPVLEPPRPWLKYKIAVSLFLLGIVGVTLFSYKPSKPLTLSYTERFTHHSNGWCSLVPHEVVALPHAAGYRLYVDRGVPVDQVQYFLYFEDEYQNFEVVQFQGFEPQRSAWEFAITKSWVTSHAHWEDALRWRIDFECP